VEQGYTVFVMSWVNPDERHRDMGFDGYVRDGVFAALDAVEQASGESRINALGYCIGGTLLAIALAHMAATGDRRVNAATFLAAQVDFEEAGDLRAFTGPRQLAVLEPEVMRRGYLDGEQMASAFNLLRANDLIWHYVINNYLLGKSPPPFELLYWNADSTRLPARMLIEYLRSMYQENRLATAGAFEVLGTPIDLARITIPTFIQATREDHISPARSVWKCMQRFSGSKRFVLAGSGHIAGVVNPPRAGRYQHWTNDARKTYDSLDAWLADAKESPGSWWPTWQRWLARRSGARVRPRVPGEGALRALEPAPGSYVKVRCRADQGNRSRPDQEGTP
jgi:polyhydroxyalkanoate synthase